MYGVWARTVDRQTLRAKPAKCGNFRMASDTPNPRGGRFRVEEGGLKFRHEPQSERIPSDNGGFLNRFRFVNGASSVERFVEGSTFLTDRILM